MKKLTIVIAVLALVVACSSCNKAGKYNPRKKISRIYREGDGISKYMAEIWTWNKNKLDRIDHYSSSGNLNYTELFSYNKKGYIERITSGSSYTQFTYDGNKLVKAQRYIGGTLYEDYEFTYKGSKLSKMTETYYSNYKGEHDIALFSPLRLILPESTCEKLNVFQAKHNTAKGTYTYSTEIEWDGKNISKVRHADTYSTDYYEVTFKYDKKNNPFLNLLDVYVTEDGTEGYSKNNVTEENYLEYEDGESYTDRFSYSYTYDGNWPSSQRYTEPDGWWYTYYFEYMK